jgi:hypothetical protein
MRQSLCRHHQSEGMALSKIKPKFRVVATTRTEAGEIKAGWAVEMVCRQPHHISYLFESRKDAEAEMARLSTMDFSELW